MLLEFMILFIIIIVILFVLIVDYLFAKVSPTSKVIMDTYGKYVGNWRAAIPLIIINMFFIIIASYGFYKIDWMYIGSYFVGNGSYVPNYYSISTYDYMAEVFYGLFGIHIALFIYCGYYAILDSMQVKNK